LLNYRTTLSAVTDFFKNIVLVSAKKCKYNCMQAYAIK